MRTAYITVLRYSEADPVDGPPFTDRFRLTVDGVRVPSASRDGLFGSWDAVVAAAGLRVDVTGWVPQYDSAYAEAADEPRGYVAVI